MSTMSASPYKSVKVSDKLFVVLRAMAEGETLWFDGKYHVGSERVNGNVLGLKVFGWGGPALVERDPDAVEPKGVLFYRLTDAGRAVVQGR